MDVLSKGGNTDERGNSWCWSSGPFSMKFFCQREKEGASHRFWVLQTFVATKRQASDFGGFLTQPVRLYNLIIRQQQLGLCTRSKALDCVDLSSLIIDANNLSYKVNDAKFLSLSALVRSIGLGWHVRPGLRFCVGKKIRPDRASVHA